jgi:hypothetical protein
MKPKLELWLLIGLLVVLAYSGGEAIVSGVEDVMQSLIAKISYAIATAEGFFVPGSRPQRNHNPGDFETDITGAGVGFDGPYVIYPSDSAGWAALDKQVGMMLDGTSHIYNPNMTIAQVAQHWTATEQTAWAENVAAQLGVTVFTRLSEIS